MQMQTSVAASSTRFFTGEPPKVLRKYLTRDEDKKLFNTIKARAGFTAERDYAALKLMRLSGARVAVICALTVADAQDAIASGELAFRDEISKRRCGYSVPVTNEMRGHLKALLKLRRDANLGLDQDAPLVIARTRSRGGEGMTPRALQLRMRYWSEAAGLPVKATPHWLRHTLGQRAVRSSTAENPLLHAAALLGHRSLASTRVYTQPTREEIARTLAESGK